MITDDADDVDQTESAQQHAAAFVTDPISKIASTILKSSAVRASNTTHSDPFKRSTHFESRMKSIIKSKRNKWNDSILAFKMVSKLLVAEPNQSIHFTTV